MINILTDSTSDIPKDQLEKYQIEVIPMYVQLDGKVYRDGEEITSRNLFDYVQLTGQYPTTSAPSPGDFIKFFDRKTPSIYIGVSGALSSTYMHAQLAVKELGNSMIDLIDSKSISTGYGQIVLQAAEWRNNGIGFEELGFKIREMVRKSRGILLLDSLDYLYHGGRCSAIENFVSSILRIRPILQLLPSGELGVLRKVRGSRIKVVNLLLSYFLEQVQLVDYERIFLMHLECDDEIDYMIEKIKSSDMPLQIEIGSIGCALATHSGPKPLGIAYTVK